MELKEKISGKREREKERETEAENQGQEPMDKAFPLTAHPETIAGRAETKEKVAYPRAEA